MHDFGSLEQPGLLLRWQPVQDVAILEDLRQTASSPVLARDVRNHLILGGIAGEQE